MKKFFLSVFLFGLGLSPIFAASGSNDLKLAITPIRMSIDAPKGNNTVGSITLYNNSDLPYSFYLNAEDCTVAQDYSSPVCTALPANSGVNPNSLASWITFDLTGLFTVPARSSRVVIFTIHTPSNAIPGGHYGAIFFNTQNTSTTASIAMNRRIGSLLLVTVPGTIIVAPEFGNIEITNHGGGYSSGGFNGIDLFTFNKTGSILDQIEEKGQKLLMTFSDTGTQNDVIEFINPLWSAPELDPNISFNTSIALPVKNKGTIHIVPEGKITIHEIDGKQLINIGKEYIINQNGAVIGERKVDYLTINEGNGNVLPGTNRTFTMNWYGFAQESVSSTGAVTVSYETPGAYYTRLTREKSGFLYPWEKYAIRHTTKELEIHIELSYFDPVKKQTMSSNSVIPFIVEYDEVTKTWNFGVVLSISFLLFVFIFFMRRRKKGSQKTTLNTPTTTINEIEALKEAHAMILAKKEAAQAKKQSKANEAKITPKKSTKKIPSEK